MRTLTKWATFALGLALGAIALFIGITSTAFFAALVGFLPPVSRVWFAIVWLLVMFGATLVAYSSQHFTQKYFSLSIVRNR